MNKQEMLNTAVPFLIKQAVPSMTENGTRCLYRGPNGTKCAIGCIIPDDRYQEQFDGVGFISSLKGISGVMPDILGDDIPFLRALQQCHDLASTSASYTESGIFVPLMLENFRQLAGDYKLIWNEEWKVETPR